MPFPHNNLGRDEIIKCYDLNELTDIANNGCANCAPHSHHLYADTIHFFSKHEAEILSTIEEQYGMSELYKLFEKSQACYDMYRNECTWLFIETVAQDVVQTLEEIAEENDKELERIIEEYKQPVDWSVKKQGFNDPQSMTLPRYSQV